MNIMLAALNVDSLPKTGTGSSNPLPVALSIFFTLVGLVAVLMVVIGGFKYVMSQGKPEETAKAKDTIIYAIVGIAVCVLAEAFVKFVLGRFL